MVTYPRIKFECEVDGKELVAEVQAQEVKPGHYSFNTRFSDGFEDTYLHDERAGLWKAIHDKKRSYLKQIKDDLSALVCYQIDRAYFSFRHLIGTELVNIWVFETQWEDRSMIYTIYYKGDYQFDMKKIRGAWYAHSVRSQHADIDDSLVSTIGGLIEAKMKR